MDQAFTLLRQHARTTNQRLTDVARHDIDSPTADFPPAPAGNRDAAAGTKYEAMPPAAGNREPRDPG